MRSSQRDDFRRQFAVDRLNLPGLVQYEDVLSRALRNKIRHRREKGILWNFQPITTADVYGVIEILDTPSGKIIQSLIESGVTLGISSRGVGSTKRQGDTQVVQDDFQLICFDMVSWYDGAMIRRYDDKMIQQYNSSMTQYHNAMT
mgnify:CR=1 FL=1